MPRLSFVLAAGLTCGASPVYAGDFSTSAAEPIIVTADHGVYGTRITSSATKTPTPVKDLPQALTTVTQAQIKDQQLRSVGDLLLFVPGASYGSGEGNRDQLVLRGNSSTADFFVDGVRDDAQYFRDLYNVERVEVLKGPNAMTFGRGGGGGIINRIIKRPAFKGFVESDVSLDDRGAKRLSLDADWAGAKPIGARLNAIFEDSDLFRHHDRLERYGINPTIAIQPGDGSRVDLGVEHFHDWRTADRGVPADGDMPVRGSTRTFFGDPNVSFSRANVDLLSASVSQSLGKNIALSVRTQFGDYRKFYQNIFPNSFNPVSGLVALAGYNNRNDRRSLLGQANLVWTTKAAGLEHVLLTGFELGEERSRNAKATAVFLSSPTVPLTDPTVDADVIFAPLSSDANNRVNVNVASFYGQDQVHVSSCMDVIAGIRFDSVKIVLDDRRPSAPGRYARVDRLWSPRLGLVLKPTDSLSLYASYSRSFLPQSGDQFGTLTITTQALKPERFKNKEVGAKLAVKGGLLATLAFYELDRTNTRATSPTNPGLTVLTGAQRSKGIEVGLEGDIAPGWQISGGYSFERAKITSDTTAAPAGRRVPLVPRHSFSIWNKVAATQKLSLGIGVIARSKSFATISNAVVLPAYARVDAGLFYTINPALRAQLNVENILGARYFPTANADNNIIPGALRTIRITLQHRI